MIDLTSIRNKSVQFGHISASDWNYDMYDFMKYLQSHPLEYTKWQSDIKRLALLGMENRSKSPEFCKKIIKDLRKAFPLNTITCHAYCAFTDDGNSAGVHKDVMDVLYLQVLGKSRLRIWDTDVDETDFFNRNPDREGYIHSKDFDPGDWCFIPRGVYHSIEPLSPRIGFSFGLEGIDPSEYI